MDSFERKQLRRSQESCEKWKIKALGRQKELRKKDDKIRDLQKSKELWKDKFQRANKEVEEFKKKLSAKN